MFVKLKDQTNHLIHPIMHSFLYFISGVSGTRDDFIIRILKVFKETLIRINICFINHS